MPVFIQQYSVAELRFDEIQIENKFKYDKRAKWETYRPNPYAILNVTGKDDLVTYIATEADESYAILYWDKGSLVLADLSKKSIAVTVVGDVEKEVVNIIDNLKKVYVPEPESIEGRVKVRFWYATNSGPKNVTRTISVPNWDSIQKNYEDKTLEQLKYLIEEYHARLGGQLIIMSGPPGTGKSYYLRSLLNSWKDWCQADYVLDPENLFGNSQGYLADVVLRDSYDDEYDETGDQSGKWKLLILEDNGELLVPDAKERVGQALSRLLNLVDGLIGQGLRVLVLITTNEEFHKLHPAVSRDGRCAAAIEFNTFDREKAEQWMNGNSPKLPAGKNEFTLAELYALSKGTTVKKLEKESAGLGFKMR